MVQRIKIVILRGITTQVLALEEISKPLEEDEALTGQEVEADDFNKEEAIILIVKCLTSHDTHQSNAITV